MDYIYSNLNNKNIDDNSDIDVTWTAYESLPNPSKLTYMTMAVVNAGGGDNVYLCIKQGDAYTWKLLCRAAGQLAAPVIVLNGSILSWAAVTDAAGYAIYENDTVITTTTNTSYDLSELFTTVGTHRVCVVAKAAQGSEFEDSVKSNVIEFLVAQGYYAFVNAQELTTIPNTAVKTALPSDYKTNGIAVHYTTVGEQYEYFAYPSDLPDVVDVVQSGQHIIGAYKKLDVLPVKAGVEHKMYRSKLPQIDVDSVVTYYIFRTN